MCWQPRLESLSFFSYQSFSSATFTFTGVSWSIVSGDVNAGTVVASGTGRVINGGLQGYRVASTTLANTDRPIFELIVDIPDFTLTADSYWLRWAMDGTAGQRSPAAAHCR